MHVTNQFCLNKKSKVKEFFTFWRLGGAPAFQTPCHDPYDRSGDLETQLRSSETTSVEFLKCPCARVFTLS